MNPNGFLAQLKSAEEQVEEAWLLAPLQKAAKAVGKKVEGNFQRNEDGEGVKWKKHAPLTIALHGEHELLRLSYDMFHAAIDMDDPGAKWSHGADREIVFGVDGAKIPYAFKHQEGFGNIPARSFMYLRDEDSDDVAEVFMDAIDVEKDIFSL